MWRDHKLVMLLCASVSLKQALWPVISKRPLELDDEGSMATVLKPSKLSQYLEVNFEGQNALAIKIWRQIVENEGKI